MIKNLRALLVPRALHAEALLLLFMAAATPGRSQSGREETPPELLDQQTRDSQVNPAFSRTTQYPASQFALESVVNPDRYIVGPSDVIVVNIWINPPLVFNLIVTPEGTLIVPTVGEVKVFDLSLTSVKEKIVSAVRKQYTRGEVSVTLVKPRPIIVRVYGRVLNPGAYTVTAADRVSRVIEEANRESRTQSDGGAIRTTMSRRNIVLKHRDGTAEHVDLDKYIATLDDHWSPFLRGGDLVVVPEKDPDRSVIGVYGGVNVPGRFEWSPGDSLMDLLALGQGLRPGVRMDSAVFSRLCADGSQMTRTIVDLGRIKRHELPDMPVQPGDRLLITGEIDARQDFVVYVEGEVRAPGTYPISLRGLRLADIIREAGGFTANAELSAAQIYHHSEVDAGLERLEFLRNNFDPEDTLNFRMETDLRLRREFRPVDFVKLFVDGDSTNNVSLTAGDHVVVPSKSHTLYVFGQVVNPGYIGYIANQSVDYYVDRAGGYTDLARPDDLRIIKAKNRQWLRVSETTPEPGDLIWIPRKPQRSFAYYMTVLSEAASILGVAVTVAVLVVQLRK